MSNFRLVAGPEVSVQTLCDALTYVGGSGGSESANPAPITPGIKRLTNCYNYKIYLSGSATKIVNWTDSNGDGTGEPLEDGITELGDGVFNIHNVKITSGSFTPWIIYADSLNTSGSTPYDILNHGYHFPFTLEEADLTGLDVSNVTDFSFAFASYKGNGDSYHGYEPNDFYNEVNPYMGTYIGANLIPVNRPLKFLDISNWNTAKAEITRNMFMGRSIENLNLKSFNTKSMTKTERMFYDASIDNITISPRWTIDTDFEMYGTINRPIVNAINIDKLVITKLHIKANLVQISLDGGNSWSEPVDTNALTANGIKIDRPVKDIRIRNSETKELIFGPYDIYSPIKDYNIYVGNNRLMKQSDLNNLKSELQNQLKQMLSSNTED